MTPEQLAARVLADLPRFSAKEIANSPHATDANQPLDWFVMSDLIPAIARIAALTAQVQELTQERDRIAKANHRQAYCIQLTAQAVGVGISGAMEELPKEAATLRARLAAMELQVNALTVGLDKARAQDREPDYCYDDEWEYTMRWDEWPDLVDSHDLAEPMAVNTLYNGPTKWVVRVPLDTDGDGEADDFETKMFDSKDEARAAIDGGSNG